MTIIKIIKNYKYDLVFITLTLLLLIYRITLHADTYDEIININVSYRVALGQIPFYQCWEAFQNGDLLLAPFIWLYITMVGKSSGIILFTRFLNLIFMSFCGLTVYKTTQNILRKRQAFYLGYSCLFFQVYSLYYLWYDTFAVIFLILSTFITFGVLSKAINAKWLILGGLFSGFMAFSYPSFILIIAFTFILILIETIREKKCYIIYYILGGSMVVIIFFLILFFYIGIENFNYGLKTILSYRSVGKESSANLFYDIVSSFLAINKLLILPTIILLCLFYKATKAATYKAALIMSIIFFSFVNSIFVLSANRGYANFMGYIALWAPFLYVLTNKNRLKLKKLLIFVWSPSMISSIAVTLTSVYSPLGPVKSWQAFFPAGLVAFCIMINLLCEQKYKLLRLCKIEILLIVCLLANFYNYIYLNQKMPEENRMEQGIYKGIKVNKQMRNWKKIQDIINIYTKGKKTIMAAGDLRPIYLMTDLLPLTPSVESPNYYKNDKLYWDMSIKYFNHFKQYPDIMFLQPKDLENKQIKKLLEDKYELTGEEQVHPYEILVYELEVTTK